MATISSTTFVSSGQSATDIVVSGGRLWVEGGGQSLATTVESGGLLIVESGGFANGTTASGSTAAEYVQSGGSDIASTAIAGGYIYVQDGSTASEDTASSGGTIEVDASATETSATVVAGGTITVESGGTIVDTTASGDSTSFGNIFVSSGGTASATILNSYGVQDIYAGASATSTTVNSGGFEVVSGGSSIDAVINSGGTEQVESGGVASNVTLENGGQVFIYSGSTVSGVSVATGGEIYVSSGGALDLTSSGNASGINLFSGGEVDLEYATYSTGATTSFDSGTDVLTVSDGSEIYTVQLAGDYTGDAFNVTSASDGSLEITLCFFSGTRLASETGEIEVQHVSAGSKLMTANGDILPVRWAGHSKISTRFSDPLRTLPVRIKANALASGIPRRDLLVSPDHAIFIDGMLINASALINGTSIVRESDVPEVFTYYHIELDTHELLLAEGCAAESFVDTTDRFHFSNWEERGDNLNLAPISEMPYPRAKSRRQVPSALIARLSARASVPERPAA